ncbi:Hypothetical_protein [Hexamita inflata]|uniref:Hypothetical_protein n=1 Tax=Hexamita inflata TaxID=28002 RepID=A0ABP1HJY9_9EUKA
MQPALELAAQALAAIDLKALADAAQNKTPLNPEQIAFQVQQLNLAVAVVQNAAGLPVTDKPKYQQYIDDFVQIQKIKQQIAEAEPVLTQMCEQAAKLDQQIQQQELDIQNLSKMKMDQLSQEELQKLIVQTALKYNSELRTLQEQNEQEQAQLERDMEEANAKKAELQKSIQITQDKIKQVEQQRRDYEADYAKRLAQVQDSIQKEEQSITEQITRIKAQIEENSTIVNQTTAENNNLTEKIAELKNEQKQIKEQYEQDVEKENKKFDAVCQKFQIKKTGAAAQTLNVLKQAGNNNVEAVQKARREELMKKADTLKQEIEKKSKNLQQIEDNTKKLEEMETQLNNQIQLLQFKHQQLEQKYSKTQDKDLINNLRKKAAENEERIKELNQQLRGQRKAGGMGKSQ